MGNTIDQKQSSEQNIQIAAAFRYAYARAKFWKSWVWGLTITLVVLQLIASINHQPLKAWLPDDLAAMVVSVSLALMLMGTIGKHYLVNKHTLLGSKLQQLHDYNILSIGSKPNALEVSPSLIDRYSGRWLRKHQNDRKNLSEWWPSSVSELPYKVGVLLCLLSTFKWEAELRKKYKQVLLALIIITAGSSLLLMYILDYKLSSYIVNILVPISPFLALLIDEYLTNDSAVKIANSSADKALQLWDSHAGISDEELNRLNYQWGCHRSTISPIFDWLYWVTQKTMNRDMIIDANELVSEYKQRFGL